MLKFGLWLFLSLGRNRLLFGQLQIRSLQLLRRAHPKVRRSQGSSAAIWCVRVCVRVCSVLVKCNPSLRRSHARPFGGSAFECPHGPISAHIFWSSVSVQDLGTVEEASERWVLCGFWRTTQGIRKFDMFCSRVLATAEAEHAGSDCLCHVTS